MSEYETASPALQELSIRAVIGAGLLHAVPIGCGLWMMRRASSDRNRAMGENRRVADRRHDEARQRHEEAMTAPRALIERTAPPLVGARRGIGFGEAADIYAC